MFSPRRPERVHANHGARAVEPARASGATLLDLTETNSTIVDIGQSVEWTPIFDRPEMRRYHPEPFGLPAARAVVCPVESVVLRVQRVAAIAGWRGRTGVKGELVGGGV